MKKFRYLSLAILALIFIGCDNENDDPVVADPEAVTQDVIDLGMYSVTMSGSLVLSDIKKEEIAFGFEYSTDNSFSGPATKKVKCPLYDADFAFKIPLTNLPMGTEFFYRAYVTYKDVTYYGEIKSFTTVGVEVRTGDIDPDNFTVTSSAGMGNDAKSVRFGICYGPTKNVTIDNNTIGLNEAGEDGSYTLTITPIPYGTVYYRAYVTIDGTTFYGEEKSVEGNSIVTGDINVENMSVESSWIKIITGYDNLTYGICYGSKSDPTISDLTVKPASVDLDNKFNVELTDIPFGTVYYRAFLMIGSSAYYGETKSFRREMKVGNPVDLGLSVKWASMNVGADVPSDAGCYFAWGETADKEGSSWSSYRHASGDMYFMTKYNTNKTFGAIDGKTVLERIDDAAYTWWGNDWRMPTVDEFKELCNNCDWVWTTQDGMNGYLVKSRVNENSIFLPAVGYYRRNGYILIGEFGYYWSCSLHTTHAYGAYICYFYSESCIPDDLAMRTDCLPVRPVSEK
jgi:hypothetical protein